MPASPLFVINCDRLSPLELACYGSRIARTPHFDQFCASGCVFHEHYRTENDETESLKADLRSNATLIRIDGTEQDAWREELNRAAVSDARLVWLDVSTGDDAEAVRQQLETVSERLHETQPAANGLFTAAAGRPHAVDPTDLELFAEAIAESVTIPNWLPLILFGDLADREKQSGHCTQLTSSRALWQTLADFLQTDANADFSFPPADTPELVLQTETAVGLRTAGDLFVAPRSSDFEQTDETPRSASYFVKPDDRFDVNDLITTVPDTALERWQSLCSQVESHQ